MNIKPLVRRSGRVHPSPSDGSVDCADFPAGLVFLSLDRQEGVGSTHWGFRTAVVRIDDPEFLRPQAPRGRKGREPYGRTDLPDLSLPAESGLSLET